MDFIVFVSEQWLLVSLLCVLIYVFAWTEKRKGGPTLSIHAMTRLINQDQGIVIDLRDNADFRKGHIVDAINVPHSKIAEHLVELAKHKEKTLILVDKMGQHTGAVGRTLGKEGFTVSRLEGGISEWQNQNLPLVTN